MPSKASSETPRRRSTPAEDDVEGYLAALDHPLKPEILALRRIILGADPAIGESIKWNAPSFRTREHFATLRLRSNAGLPVILHFGAKMRDDTPPRGSIPDPERMLQWLADDRASVTFRDVADIEARKSAFENVIREWIRHV